MPRGQKTCPACGQCWGPRTKICSCKYDFFKETPVKATATAVAAVEPAKEELPSWRTGRTLLLTPAGAPTPWCGNLAEWMDKVAARFQGYDVGPDAYKFWLHLLLWDQPEEFKRLAQEIEANFAA